MAEARALYRALYRETRMTLMPSLRDKWRANLREGFHASRNLRGAEAAAQVDRGAFRVSHCMHLLLFGR